MALYMLEYGDRNGEALDLESRFSKEGSKCKSLPPMGVQRREERKQRESGGRRDRGRVHHVTHRDHQSADEDSDDYPVLEEEVDTDHSGDSGHGV